MLRTALLLIGFVVFALPATAEEKGNVKPEPAKSKVKKLFDGKTLKGWKINDQGFYEDHGKVTVKAGEILLGKGDPATGIVLAGNPPKMNYEVRLEAKRVEGGDFFCGLTFPVGDAHQTLIIGGWGGGVTGVTSIDGMSAVENETTGYTEFENNQWYKIRLRVKPKHVQVWLDDEEIIHYNPEGRKLDIWIEQDTTKPLGIGTWNTGAALRNLELETLNEADTKKPTS
ncbi:3-keto-disaccharide hydrolase [Bremerella alba]|uniref:3-keto-alpha-glucoside-1,2-lyase/3-keto-2-hydroxy-glucal hydratase domain-containing protein n=1 Tax=Bremerella alba TaxID=980252 RepID=A0A7V9A5C3_9BACT|nr:DUF1080 domain-containing protein [Bremerella alba]MBA2113042.1 hypothetical protein [Bremerella alba]